MRAAAIVATSTGNWDGGPQRDRLITAAHAVLSNCGVELSFTKVRRMVQNYERRAQRYGFDFGKFIANQVVMSEHQRRVVADELRKVTAHVDPTGEAAVNRVLRGDS
jgi:hypothetical protein